MVPLPWPVRGLRDKPAGAQGAPYRLGRAAGAAKRQEPTTINVGTEQWKSSYERLTKGLPQPPDAERETEEDIARQYERIHAAFGVLRARLDAYKPELLLMVGGEKSVAQPAYSLRARNAKSARELFDIVARGFTRHRLSGRHSGRDSQSDFAGELGEADGHQLLHIRPRHGDGLVLSVVQDSLVLAANSDVIAEVRELADKPRSRSTAAATARRNATIRSRLARLGASRERASGVVAFDLSFLAERFGESPREPDSLPALNNGLFGLHAGVVSFERDLVRLKIFTELPAR